MKTFELDQYPQILKQLLELGKSFKVVSTNYTKRIIGEDFQNIMFSDEEQDFECLTLINMVRTDAEFYKKREVFIDSIESYDIDFYSYIDKGEEETKIKGLKIDLNQAYWDTAINMGLLSEKTIERFEEIAQTKTYKEVKQLRLKSLGSLATNKRERFFKDGKEYQKVYTEWEEMQDKALKYKAHQNRCIYLYICDKVAEVMSRITHEFFDYVIYWYWDCLFLKDGVRESEVFKAIEREGYRAKVEGRGDFEIRIKDAENRIYFSSGSKTKDYPVKIEDIIY